MKNVILLLTVLMLMFASCSVETVETLEQYSLSIVQMTLTDVESFTSETEFMCAPEGSVSYDLSTDALDFEHARYSGTEAGTTVYIDGTVSNVKGDYTYDIMVYNDSGLGYLNLKGSKADVEK